MNIKTLAILAILYPAFSMAQSGTGPFGYDIGADISTYKDCTPNPSGGTGAYLCTAPARGHPDLSEYQVEASPNMGICWIVGFGKDIDDEGAGIETMAAVDKIARQLAITYGSSFQKNDTVYEDPYFSGEQTTDWFEQLSYNERIYNYVWGPKTGYQPKKRVLEIQLEAVAELLDWHSYVAVSFYGDNYELCQEELSNSGA